MIKQTPFYHLHTAAGATFEDRIGFAAPVVYSTVQEEHMAVRERVGMFDVYYQVAVEVKGADAEKLLSRLLVNDVRRMPDQTVLYSSICHDGGGIVDDLTAFKFNASHFWLFPTPSRVNAVVEFAGRYVGDARVAVTNLGYCNAYISLQGPHSRDVLSKLTDVSLASADLPYYQFTVGSLTEVPKAVLSRTGYSGELGYELFFPVEYAEHVWRQISKAGEPFGIRPCGLRSLRTLRIEKKYLLYGLDIDESTNPLAAGLGWTVRFDDRDFVGRAALEKIKAQGPPVQLRLLDLGGFHPVNRGDPVFYNGEQVATITSAEAGYALGSTFAFAYLPGACAAKDAQVSVEVRKGGDRSLTAARVLDQPPYDPKRLKATA